MKTITVVHDYDVAPETLWACVTDFDALQEVMQGLVTFEGLPAGRTFSGQRLEVMVSLFGKLPAQPYTMHVLECDDEAMLMRSDEKGAGVKTWQHCLKVTKTPNGCELRDVIDIDAGWLTRPMAAWARYMYHARHKPRLALLQTGRFGG